MNQLDHFPATHLLRPALAGLLMVVGLALGAGDAAAQEGAFEFLAPPATTSNRVYRVDVRTGAMAVCWFNGTHTECLNGAGLAGPQTPGRYGLVASNKPDEKGIFRIDRVSGVVSNCWVHEGALTCSFPVR